MLVLTRKAGEKIVIAGNVTVTLLSCEGERARIGIDAPREVTVLRAELVKGGVPATGPGRSGRADNAEAP